MAFGCLIAFGELLRLALPGNREAAPIATTGALAYALLLQVAKEHHGLPLHIPALQVIAVTAVGMTLGALPHIAAGRPAGLTGMASRLVAVGCVAFIFRPFATSQVLNAHRQLVDRVRRDGGSWPPSAGWSRR